jgi:Bifunctional DNA primase/polymerase, N-terminal/AAA domain/Primase C terminal 2 (PriCT-2)
VGENKKLLLSAALDYAKAGIWVFPCEPANKEPCGSLVGRDKNSQGNWVPKTGGVKKATRDPALIQGWWTMRPDAMIGAATGAISGFFVIDPDRPKPVARGPLDALTPDGVAAWNELKSTHGGHEPTIEITTPSGGCHVWFLWDAEHPVTNREGGLSGLGINVRGDGGYVILPPSCRWPDGKAYVANQPFNRTAIAPAPTWLYDLMGALIGARRKVKRAKSPLPNGQDIGPDDDDGALPWTPELEHKVRDALARIPPDSRDMWLSKGAAIHALGWGNKGFKIWDDWAQTAPEKYDPEDQQRTWECFDPGHPNGATYRSIAYEAKQRGWKGNIGADWSCSLICAATITPEPISWLWPYWLARGKLHIIAGSPGSAKTTVILKIVAIISCGGRFPCGSKAPQGNVIIWSGEDTQKDTLVPRLKAGPRSFHRPGDQRGKTPAVRPRQ